MLLKSGKRCPHTAKSNGMCGIHSRSLQKKRKVLDKLIAVGQIGTALSGVIKLVETVYPAVEHAVRSSGPFFRYIHFSSNYYHATRSDVLHSLKTFQNMEAKGETFDINRVVDIVFEGMTWEDPSKPFEAYRVQHALEQVQIEEQLRSHISEPSK
jgi:Family of unknown function (DUF5763)